MRALALVAYAAAALALASCELAPPKPSADLVVTPEGKLFLNGDPVAEKDLVAALKAANAQQPDLYLYIRTDFTATSLPPNLEFVRKAVQESGIPRGESTQYREQVEARRLKSLLGDILFFGGSMLLAVCVVTPFALRARTASSARNIGIVGILGLGSLIGALIGAWNGGWLTAILMTLIYFVPLSLVTGLIVGNLCWWIVGRRTKGNGSTAASRPPP